MDVLDSTQGLQNFCPDCARARLARNEHDRPSTDAEDPEVPPVDAILVEPERWSHPHS